MRKIIYRLWFLTQYLIYRGVEVIFRIFNGTIKKGDTVKFVNTKKIYMLMKSES